MTDVAVVGAGLMGHALALVFALGGHKVCLTDNDVETLERAPGLMATALATLSEAGEAEGTWNRQRLSNATRRVPSLAETVNGAAPVVEAVVERPDVKRALHAQLETMMEPNAILASNTSNLNISRWTLDGLIAEGRTGVMAGEGYFDWGDRTPAELFRERDRELLALKQALRAIGPMEGK
jgi:3-hydroxyacyl-CoA dehydrogenase